MRHRAWVRLAAVLPEALQTSWLSTVLERNAHTQYLRSYGSPPDQQAFRERVPIVSYESLQPWLESVHSGQADVLFAGGPIAYERTGGSAGGVKVIPYSREGLEDFRSALLPWLVEGADTYGVTGRLYLSISPATRPMERIGDVPIGLSDGAYLGEAAAAILSELTVVPFELAAITNVDRWRARTLEYLSSAEDLELISCWSPTFLLRLLDDLPDPRLLWPRLKVVSCWASAASEPFAAELAARLPHARLQPKGLMSTECVVTVPDAGGRPVLTRRGFFEFEHDGHIFLHQELQAGICYRVVVTTASGLYRYRTGDLVRCEGYTLEGYPILEFIGRGELVSDLVGEKLTETFVSGCLREVRGFRILVPEQSGDGYVLVADKESRANVQRVEQFLCSNPQYSYARRMKQLAPLRLKEFDHLFDRYVENQLRAGVRLGDVKPVSLRRERTWLSRLADTT